MVLMLRLLWYVYIYYYIMYYYLWFWFLDDFYELDYRVILCIGFLDGIDLKNCFVVFFLYYWLEYIMIER